MRVVAYIIIWLVIAVSALASEDTLQFDSLKIDSVTSDTALITTPVQVDSVIFIPTMDVAPGKQVDNPEDFEQHLSQNPTVALFKSMLIPGLGQIGNRRYFKAALFIGLESWFIISAIHFGKQAHDYRQAYEAAAEDDLIARRYNYILYEDRRDNRNKFTWFAGLTIFISMFDAYVDAHLSGSPYNESRNNLSMDVQPDHKGGVRALVSYTF